MMRRATLPSVLARPMPTIEYEPRPATDRWSRVRRFRRPGALVLLLAAAAFVASTTLPVRTDDAWIDGVTGTRKSGTTWPFGLRTGQTTSTSPLERRLRALGIDPPRRWHHIVGSDRSLSGASMRRSHGTAPAILSLAPLIQEFVGHASDDEIRAFVHVLQHGTDAEQRDAVDAAGDRAFSTMHRPPASAPASRPSPVARPAS
jgi:hypothetical protein